MERVIPERCAYCADAEVDCSLSERIEEIAEQIAEALSLGCEDGEYYIPAEPEPIIVSDSIIEACKAFKAQTDKWATQDEKRIIALEAREKVLTEAMANLAEGAETALRQWRMYADDNDDRDLRYDDSAEGALYRSVVIQVGKADAALGKREG